MSRSPKFKAVFVVTVEGVEKNGINLEQVSASLKSAIVLAGNPQTVINIAEVPGFTVQQVKAD